MTPAKKTAQTSSKASANKKSPYDIVRLGANTVRLLSADAVEKAKSGHPGMPMGAADYAFLLWYKYLKFNPADPRWPNRDRFILSAGHGSMLLYSLLHLFGFDMELDQLMEFRQWGSKTPGHPEYEPGAGIETTTGPLGQGFSNGIGMALAAKMSAARYNTRKHKLFDHYVYAICSDGDMMEGISHESASLAGHLKLGNIVYFYDDNSITIEGKTDLAFSENVAKRFDAYGWHTQTVNGHNYQQIDNAIAAARAETGRPSLIVCRTHIAYGAPNAHNTSEAHGAPLGEDELKATRKYLGFPGDSFHVPKAVMMACQKRVVALRKVYDTWQDKFASFRKAEPEKARLFDTCFKGEMPDNLEEKLLEGGFPDKPAATRNLSGTIIQRAAAAVPSLVGGSADLDPSTKTAIKDTTSIAAGSFGGRLLHFGVREHGMGGLMNGMAKYGGFIPYGGTFLVFSDYMRPTVRLAAITGVKVVYVFTHDSIFVGEDGPTHQPVEQVAALRIIPNLLVLRPADGVETAYAWACALRRNGPSALILTRQNVPPIHTGSTGLTRETFARGAFVVREAKGACCTLVASGSEVILALEAAELLAAEGHHARVVSMPSMELFRKQPAGVREKIMPSSTKIAAIDAGVSNLWHEFTGRDGLIIGIDRFGASAPYKVLAEKFGLTAPQVVERVKAWK